MPFYIIKIYFTNLIENIFNKIILFYILFIKVFIYIYYKAKAIKRIKRLILIFISLIILSNFLYFNLLSIKEKKNQ
jgi:hypothetical protein